MATDTGKQAAADAHCSGLIVTIRMLRSPSATDPCDGVDSNCDGIVEIWYLDGDGDGYGVTGSNVIACVQPAGYAPLGGDCNDADVLFHPLAFEGCDTLDNDCNGIAEITTDGFACTHFDPCVLQAYVVDCTCVPLNSLPDLDGDGFCALTDCNDADPTINIYAAELCDGIDNDCDGLVDEGFETYADSDGDGFGDPNIIMPCDTPGIANNLDRDDSNAALHPGALEICDGLDNDCDGAVDEGFDIDGDGFTPCTGDRNDADPNIFPGQGCVSCSTADLAWLASGNTPTQFCVSGCSATTLEEIQLCLVECYTQVGLSEPCATCLVEYQLCVGIECAVCATDPNSPECILCRQTTGCDSAYSACSGLQDIDSDGYFAPFDCDDNNAAVYPDAPEGCTIDGLDNDCDGQVDEDAIMDNDGDGYTLCTGDRNNTDASVFPGAPELCDGMDNDCNGLVDEGFTLFFRDFDGDGYGDPQVPQLCNATGGVANQLDRDDGEPTVYIGAPELCDGIDNDCDGQVDEVISEDADADGYTICSGDCDDNDPAIRPEAIEVCDGVGYNCNGLADEGFDADGDGLSDCVDGCPFFLGDVGSPCVIIPGELVPTGIINATCTCTVSCSQSIVIDLRADLNSQEASFIIRTEGSSVSFARAEAFLLA